MAKKVHLISLTSDVFPELKPLISMYQKRMRKLSFDYHVLEISQHTLEEQQIFLQKKIENISKGQQKMVVLLREEGKQLNSHQFADYVMNFIHKSFTIFFVIGSHQGFSSQLLMTFKESISLSKLTFPQQSVS